MVFSCHGDDFVVVTCPIHRAGHMTLSGHAGTLKPVDIVLPHHTPLS